MQPALDQEGHLLASVAAIPGRVQAEVLAVFDTGVRGTSQVNYVQRCPGCDLSMDHVVLSWSEPLKLPLLNVHRGDTTWLIGDYDGIFLRLS